MTGRRRRIDTSELGKYTQITIKLPEKIIDSIDNVIQKNETYYTGRSHVIEDACKYFLKTSRCPRCGTLNVNNAVICSVCEAKLDNFVEQYNYLSGLLNDITDDLNNLRRKLDECRDLFSKIMWLVNKQNSVLKEDILTLTKPMFDFCSEQMDNLDNLLCRYDDELKKYLDSGSDLDYLPPRMGYYSVEYMRTYAMVDVLNKELGGGDVVRSDCMTMEEVKLQCSIASQINRDLTSRINSFTFVRELLISLEKEVDVLIQKST